MCSHKKGGGVLGGLLLKLLDPAIGLVGLYIVIVVLTIISVVILTGKSFVSAVKTKGEEIYQTIEKREQIEKYFSEQYYLRKEIENFCLRLRRMDRAFLL